ncbi:Uu.00g096670.m01.CDS01 [Anthostomella pinea]|uniref:Uu.00g096670.m01.CDS01 n=1 Tax=Anthostomella pinea TaxID=933095 RepID=A0AAI8VCB9_9PEZI|nr:Uu.00g096670.m01.CDS01 [Anthostomella pinea]
MSLETSTEDDVRGSEATSSCFLSIQGTPVKELVSHVLKTSCHGYCDPGLLSDSQLNARHRFVLLYLETPNVVDENHQIFLQQFMESLDKFFFEGNLTQSPIRPPVALVVHDEPCDFWQLLGQYQTGKIEMWPHFRLKYTPPGIRWSFDLGSLLSTLIHEMVHAYTLIFSDPESTSWIELYYEGGHGYAFHNMLDCISATITNWHPLLAIPDLKYTEYRISSQVLHATQLVHLAKPDDDSAAYSSSKPEQEWRGIPSFETSGRKKYTFGTRGAAVLEVLKSRKPRFISVLKELVLGRGDSRSRFRSTGSAVDVASLRIKEEQVLVRDAVPALAVRDSRRARLAGPHPREAAARLEAGDDVALHAQELPSRAGVIEDSVCHRVAVLGQREVAERFGDAGGVPAVGAVVVERHLDPLAGSSQFPEIGLQR